jgi:hypothetical protein
VRQLAEDVLEDGQVDGFLGDEEGLDEVLLEDGCDEVVDDFEAWVGREYLCPRGCPGP